MPKLVESPAARVARTRPLEMSFDGDNPSHSPPPPRFQALLMPLRREIAEGCFRLASLKLAHAADNIAIADDHAAWPAIAIAEFHLGEGAPMLREVEGGE